MEESKDSSGDKGDEEDSSRDGGDKECQEAHSGNDYVNDCNGSWEQNLNEFMF